MPQDIKDGGPAFPCVSGPHLDENENIVYPVQYGMSLRDWFAGMALQGLILTHDGRMVTKVSETLPATAYVIADTMLKVRETR